MARIGSHSHAHGAREPVSARTRAVLTAIAAALALATLVGWLVLRPEGRFPGPEAQDFGTLYDARVERVELTDCGRGSFEDPQDCRTGTIRLKEGPDAGETVTLDLPQGTGSVEVTAGDDVVVAHYTNPEAEAAGVQYEFVDRDRKPQLLVLAAIFAVAVVLLGRLRGLAALVGLGASLAVLLAFVLPAILEGRSPVPVAVVGAAAIAFVALYTAHGFTARTTVALLGTLAALALTALLGRLFTSLASISGLANEEATILSFTTAEIDFSGLVLAGLVIGALGALDDMTVTQTSAVWELREASPGMSRRDLYRAGMRIGRDHVASTVNTLVLAYAGASMTLLLLFVLSGRSLVQVANGEVVAVEIVRTLVGSIGLVASVPITTWLASRVAVAPRRGKGDGRTKGDRRTRGEQGAKGEES